MKEKKELQTKIKQELRPKGTVNLKLKDTRTGEIVEERNGENLLLDEYITRPFNSSWSSRSYLNSSVFDECRLGDSDAEVDRAQTDIQGALVDDAKYDEFDDFDLEKAARIMLTYTGHSDRVYSVNFSPDGNYLASGADDNEVHIIDADPNSENFEDRILTYTGHFNTVESVNFSPDGNYLAIGSADHEVHIIDADPDSATFGDNILTYTGHDGTIYSVNYSPDGKYLASGGWSGEDNEVQIIDADPDSATFGDNILNYTEHDSSVYSVNYSPDGKYLASGSMDEEVHIIDADPESENFGDNILTYTGHSDRARSVNFSPDGNYLASGSADHEVHIIDADPESATFGDNILTYTGHSDSVWSVNYSPDGNYLASGRGDEDNEVHIIDADPESATFGDNILTYTGHSHTVYSLNYSPDGNYLASGSRDEEAHIQILGEKHNKLSAKAKYAFPATEAGAGTIKEIVLYDNDILNTGMARKIIDPAIEKEDYHELFVEWKIEWEIPLTSWSGTLTDAAMDGETDVDFDMWLGNYSFYDFLTTTNLMYYIDQQNTSAIEIETNENNETTTLEAIQGYFMHPEKVIGASPFETYQIEKTWTLADRKLEFRVTLDVDDSNEADIGSIRLRSGGNHYFRTLFDPKLEKTDVYRLHFDFETIINPQ